jgi:Protein of unknown function (DUF2851)
MTEAFLHYVWQHQYFDKKGLATTDGDAVTIFKHGFYNTNAGPDFQQATLKIGKIEWVGHVEIHLNASDWRTHNHQTDEAYDTVVLHVVWKNDKPIMRSDGTIIPTLELKQRVDNELILRYKKLLNHPASIPCADSLAGVKSILKLSALDKALAQRLEIKSQSILTILKENKNDWEETCYQILGKNFGFKINAEPFDQLTRAVPYKIILKHADKPHQVEALLFGTAGLLENTKDDYNILLSKEYQLLAAKFSLKDKILHKSTWRFLRLRPANFPTLRLAQFASLLTERKNIFSAILACESIQELKTIFDIHQSLYWQQHYRFGVVSKKPIPGLGDVAVENIVINTVAPMLAAYSQLKDEPLWMDRAVEFLTKIKPEANSITREWTNLGWKATSAFDSQALIELKNNFCNKRLCLQCVIGASLIGRA